MAPFPEIEYAPEETEAQRVGTGSTKAQTFPGAQWSGLGLTSGTETPSVASWKAPVRWWRQPHPKSHTTKQEGGGNEAAPRKA